MKLNKLVKLIKGKYINNIRSNKEISSFEFNTKFLQETSVFLSINDGYKYINKDTKFMAIITDKVISDIDKPVILVKNINKVLLVLAKYKRNKYKNTKYVGITGSVGKTTTKELLYNMLSKKYKVYKNKLNYNNHMGLPYTLANMNENYDYCILEMGMNHKNEIKYLTSICKPDIAIITNIGTSHIGNFNNIEELIEAKLEITNNLQGPLFIDKKYNNYTNYKNIINYETYPTYDIKINQENTKFNINIDNIDYQTCLKMPAIHLLPNIINCINVAKYLNVDNDLIIDAINNFAMPENRINIYKKDFLLIDDTYNASLESIIGLLNSVEKIDMDKIIILGSILELGVFSKQIHILLDNYLKNYKGEILLVGGETSVINGKHFNDNNEIITYLDSIDLNDKLILIKGSHAMKLEEIVNHLLS